MYNPIEELYNKYKNETCPECKGDIEIQVYATTAEAICDRCGYFFEEIELDDANEATVRY